MAKKTTSNAVEILQNRYVKDDPERNASVEAERANAAIARLIYSTRTEAGLTQGQLAEIVGTTQSVISRLEDSDYEGHSLSMLQRIAEALHKKLTVVMTAKDPYAEKVLDGAWRPSHNQKAADVAFAKADARAKAADVAWAEAKGEAATNAADSADAAAKQSE